MGGGERGRLKKLPLLDAFKSQLEGTYNISLLLYTVNVYCDHIYIYIFFFLLFISVLLLNISRYLLFPCQTARLRHGKAILGTYDLQFERHTFCRRRNAGISVSCFFRFYGTRHTHHECVIDTPFPCWPLVEKLYCLCGVVYTHLKDRMSSMILQ